jgi:hypothetical protein
MSVGVYAGVDLVTVGGLRFEGAAGIENAVAVN